MRIYLLAIGTGMPAWLREGYVEYASRLRSGTQLELVEIPATRRAKGADLARIREREGQRLLQAVPNGCRIAALDAGGRQWTTEGLAEAMAGWLQDGRDLALLIGGPEGLSATCLEAAEWRWSLSKLTFPHPLVRLIVAEQLYRGWSILQAHPYHR